MRTRPGLVHTFARTSLHEALLTSIFVHESVLLSTADTSLHLQNCIELLECLKSWFPLSVYTENLRASVHHLGEGGRLRFWAMGLESSVSYEVPTG